MNPSCTRIRDEWIQTVFLISAEHIGKVQHNISMEIGDIPFLLIISVRHNATFYISIIFKQSSSLSLKTIISNTQTDSGSKPLSYSNVQCRSKSFSKIQLTVIISKIHLGSQTTANKPISSKAVCLYAIASCCFFFFLIRQTNRNCRQ